MRMMARMRPEIRNRVTMLDSMVTTEVPSDTPDTRRWLMVQPADGDGVLLVEAEASASAAPEDYLSPDDVVEIRRQTFASLDAVVAQLDDEGVDTDTFEAPWDTDNPF